MITLNNFEGQYISLRREENRLYMDEQVKWLPEIGELHPHYKEWQIRKHSCNKLLQHLSEKRAKLNILEVGCGNGWLCAQLSKIPGSSVVGIDINKTELDQAKRVFGFVENLEFIYCDIHDDRIAGEKFDAIVFAASIQYFPSFDEIISEALHLLSPGGEIHLVDSFFYKPSELEAARKRSNDYFNSLDFSGMSDYYFHRCLDELKPYKYQKFYDPGFLTNRFAKNKNPFHWICIYHA